MPVVRALSKVAKQALLSPACGCQPLAVAIRNISFSPRQVTSGSDASFHSVSFSETDHPKVLITGMENIKFLVLWHFVYLRVGTCVICQVDRNGFSTFFRRVDPDSTTVFFAWYLIIFFSLCQVASGN